MGFSWCGGGLYCRTALGRAAEFPRGPEPRSGDKCPRANDLAPRFPLAGIVGQASRLPGGDKPLPYKTETKRGQVYSSQKVSRSAHSSDQFRSVGEGFIPSRAIAFRFCRADEFQPERVPTQWWRRRLFGRRDAIHSCRGGIYPALAEAAMQLEKGGIYAAPTGNGLQLVRRGLFHRRTSLTPP